MKTLNIMCLSILVLTMYSCEETINNNTNNIKQIRVELFNGGGSIGSISQSGDILDNFILYKSFNIENYIDCKSVIFSASMYSRDVNTRCYLELYNVTDNVAIGNSTLITNELEDIWIDSENIRDQFPKKNIDLTLKIRSEHRGTNVGFKTAYLYIEF